MYPRSELEKYLEHTILLPKFRKKLKRRQEVGYNGFSRAYILPSLLFGLHNILKY
jgi:hypothetical protein